MLERAVRKLFKTLDDGREEIFAAAESARNECSSLHKRLLEIDRQLLIIDSKLAESDLMETIARERLLMQWSELEGERTDAQKNLDSFRLIVERAENIVSQIGMVKELLGGNNDPGMRFENLQQRQQLSMQIIKAQEEERKRMARDIHDGPAQSMANVVFRIEFCEKLFDIEPDRIQEELRDLKEITKNNLQDVRKIIFDLRPMALDDLGLVPAIKRYVDNFRESSKLQVSFNLYGKDCRLEAALEIAVFRLIQEALNNIIKHARATEVDLTLKIRPDYVTVIIEDNGIGFDLSIYSLERIDNHFGLISMNERAALLGGEMKIKTAKGTGTKIVFRLPIDTMTEAQSLPF